MTCDDALVAMITAELAELSAAHPGPLAHHLTGCQRCQRVAAQLRADSLLLAAAVAAPSAAVVRAPWRPMPWAVGVVVAATLLVMLGISREPSTVAVPRHPVVATAVTRADIPSAKDPPPPSPAPAPSPMARPRRTVELQPGAAPVPNASNAVVGQVLEPVAPTMAVAFEAPVAVVAVPLHPTPTLALAAGAGSPPPNPLPPPSGDVTVVPSRAPGVTALWFN